MDNNNCACKVCGDQACGVNFNALTCQSCKVMFRRNATNYVNIKCVTLRDNCPIDIRRRKYCQKCRLKKCFAVGIKEERILNEKQKLLRLKKIELNRKKRHPKGLQLKYMNSNKTAGYIRYKINKNISLKIIKELTQLETKHENIRTRITKLEVYFKLTDKNDSFK